MNNLPGYITLKNFKFKLKEMEKRSKIRICTLMLFFSFFWGANIFAQEIPLVYDVENTGANYPKPILPTINELPIVEPLTDPFQWSDGSGRIANFSEWSQRRNEILTELQNYETGLKPGRPDSITATFIDSVLTVTIVENGETLILTSKIILPEGDGPFPAVIGMGGANGSLPANMFSSRGIARIPFNYGQVMAHTQVRGSEPINRLYPDLTYIGAYSAWPWGVSRLIDGLELVGLSSKIDLSRLAVTGCSFAGKMALFVGAYDERIALTITQESGGGGAPAWRVSETLTGVENLKSTNSAWFTTAMFNFGGANVSKLPHDHHELMALVAPRALLVLGNSDMVWLAEESAYVSARAAHEVWKAFGVDDRFGYSNVGGHGHCALPTAQYPEVEAFIEKFLLGDTTANTNIIRHTFPNTDYSQWTEWWETGIPEFAKRDRFGNESIWLEAECGTYGKNWQPMNFPVASNSSVITPKTGFDFSAEAPTDDESSLVFNFTTTKDTIYNFFARMSYSAQDAAFWVKINDEPFKKVSNLTTASIQWVNMFNAKLSPGDHTLTVAFTKSGPRFDKLCISDITIKPISLGEEAINKCEPNYTGMLKLNTNGFGLGQNYPNPIGDKTTIPFEIPKETHVSLKIYNTLGAEIKEVAGKVFSSGSHTIDIDTNTLPKGVYFYTMKADGFSTSRKMVIKGK
jgi:hypothetical protein